jgi:hypothetical protein
MNGLRVRPMRPDEISIAVNRAAAEGWNPGLEALILLEKMVLPDRIELSTSPLPMECSTTELRQRA